MKTADMCQLACEICFEFKKFFYRAISIRARKKGNMLSGFSASHSQPSLAPRKMVKAC
jgi:hypothetical protein